MKSMTRITRVMAATAFAAIFVFSGCKKEQSVDTPAQQQEFASVTAQSSAEADGIFDDVFDNVMGVNTEVGIGGTGVFGTANPGNSAGEPISGVAGGDSTTCFILTITQLNAPDRFPLQISIDFGAGCTSRDGRTRKGKITTVYTGPLHVPGNSSTTTFEGYSVDDVHVEGSYKISNESTQNIKSFSIQVTDGKLSRDNGDYIQWNSEKTISQVEGLGTPFYPLDDVYYITGSNNGAAKKGDRFYQWSTEISEPVVKKFTCRWFVKGTIVLRKGSANVAELNYGTGECDNKATLTVNGQAVEITLR